MRKKRFSLFLYGQTSCYNNIIIIIIIGTGSNCQISKKKTLNYITTKTIAKIGRLFFPMEYLSIIKPN